MIVFEIFLWELVTVCLNVQKHLSCIMRKPDFCLCVKLRTKVQISYAVRPVFSHRGSFNDDKIDINSACTNFLNQEVMTSTL